MSKLFIGKIDHLQKKDLHKICSQYGSVKNFMMKDKFAFVISQEYSSEYEAQTAQIELDGRSINGQRILVEPARPKDMTYFMIHPRLYVGKLTPQVTKSELKTLFSTYGDVIDVSLKEDFAFVEFADYKSAKKALKELNGICLGGSRISVEEARPAKDETDNTILLHRSRLYIGKLNQNVKKQDLTNAFSAYGDIVDILMMENFAFIEFSNIQAATKALLDMNKARLCGSKILVEEAKLRKYDSSPRRVRNNDPVIAAMKRRVICKRRRSPYRSLSRSRSRSEQ